jgi:hypothetical protein
LWYWWQTLVAIGLGAVRSASQDKIRTLAVIGTAWIVFGLYQYILVRPVLYYSSEEHPNLALAQYVFSKLLPRNWITYYLWIFPVVVDSVWTLQLSIAGFSTGWLIARLHSSQRAAGVLLFAASVYAYWESLPLRAILKWGWPGLGIIPGHEVRGLFAVTVSQSALVSVIISILLGGGLLRSRADILRVPEEHSHDF